MLTRRKEDELEQFDDFQDFPRPRRRPLFRLPRRRGQRQWKDTDLRKDGTRRAIDATTMARGLGWFSLALGLAEVVAPKTIQKWIGVRRGDHSSLIRLMGLREIGHAAAILLPRNPTMGVWSRLAGDALDLGSLGSAFSTRRAQKDRLSAATAFVAGTTVVDAITAGWLTSEGGGRDGALRVKRSVTLDRSPEELYRFWHDFENLPRFMRHLVSVKTLDNGRTRWIAKGPAGTTVQWNAEVTQDLPNELIAWRSLEGADVHNAGTVRFEPAPGGRGTMVRVELEYWPPAGRLGATVAKLFGEEPSQQLAGDLRRFKQVMETGEIVRSEATLQGFGAFDQRPAQPPRQETRR